MAAIVSVINNVTVEDAFHFNQFKDALNATLGITDTAQDELGRLVLPRGTAFPGTPSVGMAIWRTDLGDAGRLYLRGGNNSWVPYTPLRQRVQSDLGDDNISSLSYVDVNGLEVSITTTGGRIKAYLIADPTGDLSVVQVDGDTGVIPYGTLRLMSNEGGSLEIAEYELGIGNLTGGTAFLILPSSTFVWDHKPATPGTYTYKIQAMVVFGGQMHIINTRLVLEEYGDS